MPLLRLSPVATTVLLAVGAISAIAGALVALAQVDLKRAFSYSTTSYLGLVFIAIALEQPAIALLLLLAHGLAKALLFMSVGSVIATTTCQDLTELGGLGNRMPATTLAYLVASAGLVGLLPLGCYWCFGLGVQVLWQKSPFFAAVFLLTNLFTALNLTRVFRSVFLGPAKPKTKRAPEVNWLMALPMVSLSVLVLLTPLLMAKIDPIPGIGSFSLPVAIAVAASGLVGLAIGSQLGLAQFWSRSIQQPLRGIQDLLAFDFYTDKIYRATIVAWVAGLARIINAFDRIAVNGVVNGIGRLSMQSADNLKFTVSGQLQTYLLTVVITLVLLLTSLNWLVGAWGQA
jgi:NAD(P)H-quinone oxidoreductase subunit 5